GMTVMEQRKRNWLLFGLLCLVGAGAFWHLANKYQQRIREDQPLAHNGVQAPVIIKELGPLNYAHSPAFTNHESRITNHASNTLSRTNLLSYRLTNTSRTIGELTYLDSAVL